MEGKLSAESDHNNEAIAILQSLMDEFIPPAERKSNTLPAIEKCKAEVKDSEGALEAAIAMSGNMMDLEKLVCSIVLTNPKDGTEYHIKPLKTKTMSVRNIAKLENPQKASVSMLGYVLAQLREMWQLNSLEEAIPEQPVVTVNGDQTHAKKGQPTRTKGKESGASGNSEPTDVGKLQLQESINLPGPKTDQALTVGPRHQVAFLQIILNGVMKPRLVVQLDMLAAPEMCRAFQKFCTGRDNLTYETTPIFQVFEFFWHLILFL